jgi:excisionase family DNA binding protein
MRGYCDEGGEVMSGWNMTGIRPGDIDSELAQRAMTSINLHLEMRTEAESAIEVLGLVDADDTVLLPRAVVELLTQVLAWLADGHGVQVMLDSAMLTTHQAAELMNVSRPYLIGLLEAEAMPSQMVGSSRRVALTDLLAYKQEDEESRRRVHAELAGLRLEFGED